MLYNLNVTVKPLLLNLTIFFCLTNYAFCQSQHSAIDSLIQVLQSERTDTNKVTLLNSISNVMSQTGDYEQAKNYANEALLLSNKIKYKKGIADSYVKIGSVDRETGNYYDALKNYSVALEIYKEINDIDKVALAYNSIGTVHGEQGDYANALKFFFASLKILEGSNYKQSIATCYSNIGNVYFYLKNYQEALNNYFFFQAASEKANDKYGLAVSYVNIGSVYSMMGNYPEALKNCFASLKTAQEINDKRGVAFAYNNIGEVFLLLKNYPKALENHLASLKISEEIGDKSGVISSYINLGKIYTLLGQYTHSAEYLTKGLKISQETGNRESIKDSYSSLARLDSTMGNYKGALKYQKLYTEIKDSILNEESNEQIAQLKIQYETDKKDKEIALLNSEQQRKTAEVEKQIIIKYVALAFAALTIIVAILLINYLRAKNKTKQLNRANEIRQRISRDLHDEIGADLTSISMTCEQAKIKALNNPDDKLYYYDKISAQSRNLSEKLSEVVWATNPENDNLESLLSFMRNYILQFFENSTIHCSVHLPDEVPELLLKPDVSRNLFFVLKEALNNAAKHSQASLIKVLFKVNTDNSYVFQINDNGKGIDYNSLPAYRSGFGNMRKRIEEIKGKFEISSQPGIGTEIEIKGNLS